MRSETRIGGAPAFPHTHWSRILDATESDASRVQGLDYLCEAYWKPLYFFVRRKGVDVEDAKDLVQAFFARLVERDFLEQLDPARGRLRSYLRTALQNFLTNEWQRRGAVRRGGGAQPASLDFEAAETQLGATDRSPEDALEREWALSVLERAMRRLEAEFQDGTRRGPFELVRVFFWEAEKPTYAEAAERFGMSEPQLKSFLHRTRARYAALLREEVAATVTDPAEIDAEIGHLLSSLRT